MNYIRREKEREREKERVLPWKGETRGIRGCFLAGEEHLKWTLKEGEDLAGRGQQCEEVSQFHIGGVTDEGANNGIYRGQADVIKVIVSRQKHE